MNESILKVRNDWGSVVEMRLRAQEDEEEKENMITEKEKNECQKTHVRTMGFLFIITLRFTPFSLHFSFLSI